MEHTLTETTGEIITDPQPTTKPSPVARWLLTGILFFMYLPMQLVIAVPMVVIVIMVEGPDILTKELVESEVFLWITLLAAGIAALLTITIAAVWSPLWKWFSEKRITAGEWLAWRRPSRIPIWVVPLITLPVLFVVGIGVAVFVGPTEIEVQEQLFSTPALQTATLIVVSTIVPAAEELIFRGALYNALLRARRADSRRWERHLLPFTITCAAFASIHLLAGFETPGAIVQIFLLSVYCPR